MFKYLSCFVIIFLIISTNVSRGEQSTFPVDWTVNTIWSGSSTLRQIAIGNHLKGVSDDTFRLFTVQSIAPQMVILFTDVSTSLPMHWRCDTIESNNAGYYGTGIGDVDRDGDNDLIYIRFASPYYLFRRSWQNTSSTWVIETIASTAASSWALAVGDADNNGFTDDIIYSTGVTASSRLYRAYWNGSIWENSEIWSGDGRTIQGIAIGNFDVANGDSNEIVVVTAGSTSNGGRVIRFKWNGTLWDSLTLWKAPDNASFTNVAIGNFDSTNVGNEIAVTNGLGPGSMARGAVIEVYGQGLSWLQRPIFTPSTSNNAWGIAIGDVMTTNPGDEVVFANSLNSPYEVRTIYGAGENWLYEPIFNIGGATYGIVIGDVNRYRTLNQEIAITGNWSIYEAEQEESGGIIAENLNRLSLSPILVAPNPTQGFLLIRNIGQKTDRMQLRMYNSTGRLVKSYNNYGVSQNGQCKLDITPFPAGVYFIQIELGKVRVMKTIVISR